MTSVIQLDTLEKATKAKLISQLVVANPVEDERVVELRADILAHFDALKLPSQNGNGHHSITKDSVRVSHSFQRHENLSRERNAFGKRWDRLLDNFANGAEVDPKAIDPELVSVESDKETGFLFRFATLLWSVPVSHGYGRRMRYLVRDKSNGKLIGVFALGDPVFNLRARDQWIGWTVDDRRSRLVHMMDAYVAGAVPPYSDLLGGKLVVALIGSAEVSRAFSKKYRDKTGIISGEQKSASLALVTTTSALGRSSLYNRLRLKDESDPKKPGLLVDLKRIGFTQGYGHFQISGELFERMRQLLADEGHPYAAGHQYGQGPNWRLRVTRVALSKLGLDVSLMRHGILREVYAMPLASNCREFLSGKAKRPHIKRPSVATISSAALERWILPRAVRRPEFQNFTREQLLDRIDKSRLELE